MPIYLDISAAVHRRAGLGRYAACLAQALSELIPDDLALFYNAEAGTQPVPGLEHLPTRTVALGYKPWRLRVGAGQLAGIGFNQLLPDARLFHATEHLLLPLKGVPTVLTVHDLIFRNLPEYHKPLNRWYLDLTMPLYCRRATRIISVSEHTRQDLIRAYRVPPDKVTVVPEAADPKFRPQPVQAQAAVRARYGLPERYVLTIGTLEPRKNLTRLLEAWQPLYLDGTAPPLVIGGKRGWMYDDFFVALEGTEARASVHLPGFIADEDLPALYSAAEVLIMPSLYEGFGLPVLEAMACGTPVACSDSSSLPEVAGDAALLFNPHDVAALREALRQLLSDSVLQEELRERGQRRAALFSWERTAQETLAVYRRAGGL